VQIIAYSADFRFLCPGSRRWNADGL